MMANMYTAMKGSTPANTSVIGPGWRRAHWGRPYWRYRRPWIGPAFVGAGFYGASYYGSCWRWRATPWGWRRVYVCGAPAYPYWRAAYPWGW